MTKAVWAVTVSCIEPEGEPRLVAEGHWVEGGPPRLDRDVPREVLDAFKRLSPLPTDIEGGERVSTGEQDYEIRYVKDVPV
jgi:hypothetical protein